MNNITPRLALDKRQARHYLNLLGSQSGAIMAELWFSDSGCPSQALRKQLAPLPEPIG